MATEDISIMIMSEHHASDCHKMTWQFITTILLFNLQLLVLTQWEEMHWAQRWKKISNVSKINRFNFNWFQTHAHINKNDVWIKPA